MALRIERRADERSGVGLEAPTERRCIGHDRCAIRAPKARPRCAICVAIRRRVRRGLDLDVLTCPDCGCRLRIRAILDNPRVARPFAAKLGLVRIRAGPEDLPHTLDSDTRYEPDPDFVDACDA